MKKLGKSLTFLTKIMLVVGLLISNLSSLSIVFASELTIDISVVDEKLNIKYLDELADKVEIVKVNVYENYTYLDNTCYKNEVTSEEGKVSSYVVSFDELEESVEMNTSEDEEIVSNLEVETVNEEFNVEDTNEMSVEDEENLEVLSEEKEISLVVDSILSDIVFDGRYDIKVEIIDITDENNEEMIATRDYGMDVLHKSGLELSVVDAVTGEQLELLDDGKYVIDYTSPKVRVVAKLLAGGLGPKDMILYQEEDYFAEDLVELEFSKEVDFSGRLYGDYTVPVVVELEKYNHDTKEYELMEVSKENSSINVLYGDYELNTLAMNVATEELQLDDVYEFSGDSKAGVVYVLLNKNKTNTMLDLYNIANYMFNSNENITFDLSNEEHQNVVSTYDETTSNVLIDELLANISLDDNTVLSLINDGLTVTYRVVFVGDANNDNILTKEDLADLIDQVLVNKEINVEKSDFYDKNGEVNTLDVMYLDQVIKSDDWSMTLTEEDAIVDSELKVLETDVVSGQIFTVEHIVKLSDYSINGIGGLFTYDETVLKLESIEVVNDWIGNNKDGHFLYVGDESLELPIIEDNNDDEIGDTENSENDENIDENVNVEMLDENLDEEMVVTEDYAVVRATFTALKSGVHTISVEELKYFNQDVYYNITNNFASVNVVVNASDNNNLSSLTVAGQNIDLIEGQLDYEITVSNEVTFAEVLASVENVAANITSIVSPEELIEGENVVTITVASENGDVKIYTVKVIREVSTENEVTTQVNYNNYYQNYENDNNGNDDEVVTELEEDKTQDDDKKDLDEEDSNVSRIIIIILILLVIVGLIYLIFKDDEDVEAKRTNKEINKLKKEEKESNNKNVSNNKSNKKTKK